MNTFDVYTATPPDDLIIQFDGLQRGTEYWMKGRRDLSADKEIERLRTARPTNLTLSEYFKHSELHWGPPRQEEDDALMNTLLRSCPRPAADYARPLSW